MVPSAVIHFDPVFFCVYEQCWETYYKAREWLKGMRCKHWMCKENSEQSDGQKAEARKKSKQKQKNKERKRES